VCRNEPAANGTRTSANSVEPNVPATLNEQITNKMKLIFRRNSMAAALALLCCGMLTGCGQSKAEFHLDMIEAAKNNVSPQQQQQIADILTAMFGTPDEPFVLPQTGLDIEKIRLASGPVNRDAPSGARGLFREHCMHCHGITGDGAGPTAAFLNPYPRDYRRGLFKFKSTRAKDEPATEDLLRTVTEGLQGTAMPAFKLYSPQDREALVEYVKYLSMRGQMELALDKYVPENLKETDPLPNDPEFLQRQLSTIVDSWKEPVHVSVGDRPDEMKFEKIADPVARKMASDRSIAIGRATFLSEKPGELHYGSETIKIMAGGCVKCHGKTQLGDGQTDGYDDWTQETWNKEKWRSKKNYPASPASALISLGALPERHIIPRNLRLGVYHGGRRPLDIYYRIHEGIQGTPMPANADSLMTPEETTALNKIKAAAIAKARKVPELMIDEDKDSDEVQAIKQHKQDVYVAKIVGPAREKIVAPRIWNLVDFVLSLPYDEQGGEMGVDNTLTDTAETTLPTR
jgi:mono/diheme cytochrome c family protein